MQKSKLTVSVDRDLKDYLITYARRKRKTMGEIIEEHISDLKYYTGKTNDKTK